MKIVSDTITDLEAQKNKISKKIGKLIEARNQEVAEAREIIRTLETINQEARNKNADLQAKIKELLKQLADYQARKEEIEKSFRNKIKTRPDENPQPPSRIASPPTSPQPLFSLAGCFVSLALRFLQSLVNPAADNIPAV